MNGRQLHRGARSRRCAVTSEIGSSPSLHSLHRRRQIVVAPSSKMSRTCLTHFWALLDVMPMCCSVIERRGGNSPFQLHSLPFRTHDWMSRFASAWIGCCWAHCVHWGSSPLVHVSVLPSVVSPNSCFRNQH